MNLSDNSYYKYRPLDDLEKFFDTILKKRLFGAIYKDLNDPMEGKFNKEGLDQHQLDTIYQLLRRTRICSLMKKGEKPFPDDFLMWSHYAAGHTGCCFEIETTNRNNAKWELIPILYKDHMPIIECGGREAVKSILSTKVDIWRNENEVRAIRIFDRKEELSTLSPYYAIKIKSVYLGRKVQYEKRDFIKRIVSSIDKSIKVYRMIEDNHSSDLYPTLSIKEI